jgi:hypothetical protein
MKNSDAPAVKREAEEEWAKEMAMTGKNRIMIYGPKDDGTYIVEFRTATGEALAISIPRTETAVIRHFQERMPYGAFRARRSVRNLLLPQGSRERTLLPDLPP